MLYCFFWDKLITVWKLVLRGKGQELGFQEEESVGSKENSPPQENFAALHLQAYNGKLIFEWMITEENKQT
jgi:hypothetical protein